MFITEVSLKNISVSSCQTIDNFLLPKQNHYDNYYYITEATILLKITFSLL